MLVPDAERAVGMLVYGTQGGRCQAKAKTIEEDFVVQEQLDLGGVSSNPEAGGYPLYKVEKRSVDTMHMERELSEALRSRVSYGGLKDKKSMSTQYVTPTSMRAARPERVEGRNFTATLVGFVDAPMSRRAVVGNRFQIILRGCCQEVGPRVEEALAAADSGKLPNFFGMQRFGARGASHLVGRALVKKEFGEAVKILLLHSGSADSGEAEEARRAIEEGRYIEVAKLLGPGQDVEALVARRLSRVPGDWVGAIRAVPIRLRRLFVNAYQSYIFNLTLSRALERGEDISKYEAGDNWGEVSEDGLRLVKVRGVRENPSSEPVPLIQTTGYGFRDYGSRFDRVAVQVMKEEGVTARMFYVDEMQEVSAEGGFRRPHITAVDHSFQVHGDMVELGFTLAKGEYATVLLREVMKPESPMDSGLG